VGPSDLPPASLLTDLWSISTRLPGKDVNPPMSQIATNGSDADLIRGVVAVIEKDGCYLVIQRSRHVRAPGAWCFPGGAIEPGESSAAAIVREVAEEIALPCRADELIWRWKDGSRPLVLDWWRVTPAHFNPVPNVLEVADLRWLTAAEIKNTPGVLPGLIEFLDQLHARVNPHPSRGSRC
jgi:8-oxo-dGTP pyrophosphatase MutT (NUDIX family)